MRVARRRVRGAWADGPYVRLTAFRHNGLRQIDVLLWRGSGNQVLMYARYTNLQELTGRPGVVVVKEDDFQANRLPDELHAWRCQYGKNRLDIHCDSRLGPGEHPFEALRKSEARYLESESAEPGLASADLAEIREFLANNGHQ
jgi:uncharacterized protein YlaI